MKNSTKLDDSLKFIDVYNIIIDLDARDGILSLMNSLTIALRRTPPMLFSVQTKKIFI